MLSIVIPAYNEERYLPRLLNSIKKQDFKDYEIIVANAQSQDRTAEIGKLFGCRVFNARRGLPSYARNDGANKAKGEIILFLDADGILPPEFLRRGLIKFRKKGLDVGGSYVIPDSNIILDWITWVAFADLWFFFMQFISPEGFGAGIFCKKKVFEELKGFDERIKFGEDCDFIKRAAKKGMKFRILPLFIKTSMRRANGKNRLKLFFEYASINFKRILLKGKNIDYKFGKSHL